MVLKTLSIRQRKSDPWEMRQQMKAALGFPSKLSADAFQAAAQGEGCRQNPMDSLSGDRDESLGRLSSDRTERGARAAQTESLD